MHRKLFTLEPFRVAERFDAWVEISRSIGVGSDPPTTPDAPFRGTLQAAISPSLSILRYDADNCPVYRLAQQIKQVEWKQFWVYREIGPGAWINVGGRELVTGPGDIIVADADEPFQTKAVQTYLHQVWMIPREILTPHLPSMPRPFIIPILASHPLNRFLQSYLDMVAREADNLTDPLALLAADHIARLIAIAAGGPPRDHVSTVLTARLERARRIIAQNLGAHDLNPERIAGELGISVRQLHLCFEPTGESLGQYVRRRRLEACKATLEDPLALQRSVMEIAFGWGFSSMPTFYRAFQNAYGAAPLEIRAAAMARHAERGGAGANLILR
ncbi:MAG: transcriptional regulator, arac family [Candidatus Kaiserbacteria bacterium]|nr:transcriptional regulator, arac family [Candidatus Kaiserbacteria bacterium]